MSAFSFSAFQLFSVCLGRVPSADCRKAASCLGMSCSIWAICARWRSIGAGSGKRQTALTFEQEPGSAGVVFEGGIDKRRAAKVVPGVGIRAVSEEEFGHFMVIIHGGRMQRGEPLAGGGVDVEAAPNEKGGGFFEAFKGRAVEEGDVGFLVLGGLVVFGICICVHLIFPFSCVS